jgi:hypothetical protein
VPAGVVLVLGLEAKLGDPCAPLFLLLRPFSLRSGRGDDQEVAVFSLGPVHRLHILELALVHLLWDGLLV